MLFYLLAAVLATRPSPRHTQAPRRYLTYLPQDNDGLADAQSEQVLRVINEDLGQLLSSSDADFWEVLATEGSLISCLDSFLRFARCCLATHSCGATSHDKMHLPTQSLSDACSRAFDTTQSFPSDTQLQLSKRVFATYLRL